MTVLAAAPAAVAVTRDLDAATLQGYRYALCFLGTGRAWDYDCSRSTTRLSEAMGILRDVVGVVPVFDGSTFLGWSGPVAQSDLCAAWDLACEYVRERAARARR